MLKNVRFVHWLYVSIDRDLFLIDLTITLFNPRVLEWHSIDRPISRSIYAFLIDLSIFFVLILNPQSSKTRSIECSISNLHSRDSIDLDWSSIDWVHYFYSKYILSFLLISIVKIAGTVGDVLEVNHFSLANSLACYVRVWIEFDLGRAIVTSVRTTLNSKEFSPRIVWIDLRYERLFNSWNKETYAY